MIHRATVLLLLCPGLAVAGSSASLDTEAIHRAASNTPSFFLNATQRVESIDAFLALAQIKGISGREQAVREQVKRRLMIAGAVEIPPRAANSNAPLNLVMELPGTGAFTNAPGILLNAHLDTIDASTPEHLAFDPESGDFYHTLQNERGQNSSFGGDDRSGVSAIAEAVRFLQANYWARGFGRRRVVMVFTADEERGCVGAKYLAQQQPEVFANLEVSLSMDGPLDFRPNPPTNHMIAVVADDEAGTLPSRRVLDLLREFSGRTGIALERTEYGLGRGDFAYFPPTAHAGLHVRSPVRGYHTKERVNVRDQINHIDLLCYVLLVWDNPLPK
jgi:putative aminopeptidase FrvX